jgi:hypothetical protein
MARTSTPSTTCSTGMLASPGPALPSDLGAAAANTSFAIGRMDSAATALANAAHFVQTGELPTDARGWKALNWLRGNEAPIEGPIPLPRGDPRRMSDGSILPLPTVDPREFPLNTDDVRLPMADPRRMADGSRIPLPMSDPRKEEGESWQPIDGGGGEKTVVLTGSAEVAGDVNVNVKVEAGSSLIAIEESVKSLVAKISGMLHTNGPGSVGKSSPDASPGPSTGGASGAW